MKLPIHFLLTLALWLAAAATNFAATYSVTLNPGFSTFANHLAPATLQSLLGPMPGGSQAIFLNHPDSAQATVSEVYISDGGDWVNADTGNPATRVVATGEGMYIYSPTGGTLVVSGPTATPSLPLGLTPGVWRMVGRQEIGPGTFENITGYPPSGCPGVEVWRLAQSNNWIMHTYGFGGWSPALPALDVGEAMWIKVTGPCSGTPPFSVQGVQPAASGDQCRAVLQVYGANFLPGATVSLKRTGYPPIGGAATAVALNGFQLSASFDLSGAAPGAWDVEVINFGGATFTLPGAFTVVTLGQPCNPCDVKVTMASPGFVAPGRVNYYHLVYQNLGASTLNNINLCVSDIPFDAVIGLVTTSPAGTLTGSGTSPRSICFAVPSLGAGQSGDFIFTLQIPGLRPPMVLHAQSTVPCQHDDFAETGFVNSYDPNDKIGLEGHGANHYITGTETLPYTITFENKASASAPAQEVFITDQLDIAKLDLATFNFGPVTFGSHTFIPTPGVTSFVGYEPYDVDGNPQNTADDILVKIEGLLETNPLDPNYGRITWTLRSIDPATGLLPLNPLRGFLPPNATAPGGEGSVSFRITPVNNLSSGDTIENSASIIFDVNETFLTGTWLNTIDVDAPQSSVDVLPNAQNTASFTVTWSGADPDSGVASYDVYVSDNNGPFTLWQTGTTATSATFNGQNKHSYRFYAVASDHAGNLEQVPATADATTSVQLPAPILQINRAVVLSWDDPAYHLEMANSLDASAIWSPIVGNSPVTVLVGTTPQFFRLVCP
jgi:hypothetical protein